MIAIPEAEWAQPIPLTEMPRGGGAKHDGVSGLALFQKMKAEREAAKAEAEAETTTS